VVPSSGERVLIVRGATTNTAPTIGAIANRSLVAGVGSGPIPFTIGDSQTAATALTLTRSSSNTALIPLANVVLGGLGANRTVTVRSSGTATGTSTITISVSDGSLSASRSFVVTVTSAPTVDTTPPATPPAPSVAGAATARPTLSGTTEAGATVFISDGGAVIGTITADGNGDWSWTPTTDLGAGTHALTVAVSDSAGNTSGSSPATMVTVPTPPGGGATAASSGSSSGSCGLGGGAAVLAGLFLAMLATGLRRDPRQ
jgi:hypothetical protein